MTSCRVNTSVIVSCQNYKVGSRSRIGMRGKSPIATTIVEVGSTITKIPIVLRQPQSSIERSRTTCRDMVERKINMESGYYDHIMTSRGNDSESVCSRQDNSIGPSCKKN